MSWTPRNRPRRRQNCGYIAVSNRVGIAQIVFAVLAIVSSLAVLAVIFGYNKDRRDLRHRILLNLFLSNLAFSAGNVAPLWMTEPGRTSRLLAPDTECHVGGVFFAGKYWMACVEVFIVAASIASLRTHSVNISTRVEAVAHVQWLQHHFYPLFFARFHHRRLRSAMSRGLHHAARCFVLTGVPLAVFCPNWGFRRSAQRSERRSEPTAAQNASRSTPIWQPLSSKAGARRLLRRGTTNSSPP